MWRWWWFVRSALAAAAVVVGVDWILHSISLLSLSNWNNGFIFDGVRVALRRLRIEVVDCFCRLYIIYSNVFEFEFSQTCTGSMLTIAKRFSPFLMDRSPSKFSSFSDFLVGLYFPLGATAIKLSEASFLRLKPRKLFHKTTAMRLYKIWIPRKCKRKTSECEGIKLKMFRPFNFVI